MQPGHSQAVAAQSVLVRKYKLSPCFRPFLQMELTIKPRLLSVVGVQFRALQGAPSEAFSMDLYHSQRQSSKTHLHWKIENCPSPL